MKLHKSLLTLFATASVLSITAITSQPVKAINKKDAVTLSYKNLKYRKVILTKPVYVRKIHWKTPRYRSTLGPKLKLKRGKKVYIQQTGTDFGWYMHIPGHKGDYTIIKRYSDYSWFKL